MKVLPHKSASHAAASTNKRRSHLARWFYGGIGFAALIWFLIRVIPKPSRAAYPCQRAAFPLASAFAIWIASILGTSMAYRHAKQLLGQSSTARATLFFALAAFCGIVAVVTSPRNTAMAEEVPTHGPVGIGKGMHPGRVVWVHAPEATDWNGFESPEYWWQPEHTDLATVDEMMLRAITAVAGEQTVGDAWDAIFRYYNREHDKGDVSYAEGEKIMIKINLTTCAARNGTLDPVTYSKTPSFMNKIDNSPQMILCLLRQLVYEAGVQPGDITVGDPTGMFPNYLWNIIHPEFPEVRCLDNLGGSGRVRAEFSPTEFHWSSAEAEGKLLDYIPVSYVEAEYLINFAILKSHAGGGVTLCAKNHYGSLLRCPDGYLRDSASTLDYFDLHNSLPWSRGNPGMGQYRALVDLMGHPDLGEKTVLYLIDGLFAGRWWSADPEKWKMPPFGDGGQVGDWPSSLFASLDPVAIDSVALDFLIHEWPDDVMSGIGEVGSMQGGAEDYLHEAAQADNPPSTTVYDPDGNGLPMASLGVHEHWNNPSDKQYSGNLGELGGIELVALTVKRPPPGLSLEAKPDGSRTRCILSWRGSFPNATLETKRSLDPDIPWVSAQGSLQYIDGSFTQILWFDADQTQGFFRLHE